MASSTYMQGRRAYARPQAMLWSDNSGVLQNGIYMPYGTEFEDFIILSDHNRGEISISKQRIESRQRMINGTMRSYFNADKINISVDWEMIPSRSHEHKITYDSTGRYPQVFKTATYVAGDTELVVSDVQNIQVGMTVQGKSISGGTRVAQIDSVNRIITLSVPTIFAAEGTTSFVDEPIIFGTMSYIVDNGASGSDMLDWYDNHSGPFWVYLSYDKSGDNLYMYNDIRQMYFSSFDHNVTKRGSNTYDFWSVNVTLEEV